MSNPELKLTVEVPADDWAYAQRRLIFLETMLLHVVRDAIHAQEWFDAGELAALSLPGLPKSPSGLAARAKAGRWRRRHVGRHLLYHVTSLPPRAFDAMIVRLLDLPEDIQPDEPDAPPADNKHAPPWVLPLMRLMRGEAQGSLSQAWRVLPEHLPAGMVLPTVTEAATVLVNLGLAERMAQA